MIEIIVMIGVIGWFANTAKRHGKSGFSWGLIGALSYYLPALLVGRVIFPTVMKGNVTNSNLIAVMIIGTVISVGIGIGFCLLARKMLLSSVIYIAEPVNEAGRESFNSLENPLGTVGYKAFDITKKNFIGKILEINETDKIITIKNDFGRELTKSFEEVAVLKKN